MPHQGIASHTGLAIGTVSIVVGAVVLLGWAPRRADDGPGPPHWAWDREGDAAVAPFGNLIFLDFYR